MRENLLSRTTWLRGMEDEWFLCFVNLLLPSVVSNFKVVLDGRTWHREMSDKIFGKLTRPS
jgi:hypothetical protein